MTEGRARRGGGGLRASGDWRGGAWGRAPSAALLDGRYLPLSGVGVTLTAATLEPGPPAALELTLRVSSGRTTTLQRQRIPVPAGRQQEATHVIRALGF
jgi:hypothetical protein